MAAVTLWTPELDALLSTMRASGHTWDDIAVALGFSRFGIIGRARRSGVAVGPLPGPIPLPQKAAPVSRAEPLPAGHPTSWGMITAGTLLDGSAFEDGGA